MPAHGMASGRHGMIFQRRTAAMSRRGRVGRDGDGFEQTDGFSGVWWKKLLKSPKIVFITAWGDLLPVVEL